MSELHGLNVYPVQYIDEKKIDRDIQHLLTLFKTIDRNKEEIRKVQARAHKIIEHSSTVMKFMELNKAMSELLLQIEDDK